MHQLSPVSYHPAKIGLHNPASILPLTGVFVLFSDAPPPEVRCEAEGKGREKAPECVELVVSLNGGAETRVQAWELSGPGPGHQHAPDQTDGMTGALFRSLKSGLSETQAKEEGAKRQIWVAALPASMKASNKPVPVQSNNRVVALACQYVQANLGEKITMKDAAREARVSMQHFCRVFRRETGLSFMQYVAELRAERACELLKDTQKSIKEVAFAAGFGSIAQFNRQFKRLRAMSPTSYREQNAAAA